MDEYRFIGTHADELESGRPLEPGEFTGPIEVTEEHPKNKQLLDDGLLIKIEGKSKLPPKKNDDDNKEG